MLACCIVCCGINALCASHNGGNGAYQRWSRLSSERLMQMGDHWRCTVDRPDSALICYTIVANRYYEQQLGDEDIKRSIEATNSIGLLYLDDFYDFSKAYSYLLQAKELAQKHHYDYFIPSIQMSMLMVDGYRYGLTTDSMDVHMVNGYKSAFSNAYKNKNWYALQNTFFDFVLHATFHGNDTIFNHEAQVIRRLPLPDTTAWLQYARLLCDGIDAWLAGDRQLSFDRFKQMFDCADRLPPGVGPTAKIIARNYMYIWHIDSTRVDDAIAAMLLNEQEARDHNKMAHLMDAYSSLSSLYSIKGDEKMADKYRIRYLETKDEFINGKRLANVGEAGLLFEMEKKNEEAKQLAYQRKVQAWVIVGISIVAAILLLMLYWLYRKYRQVRQQQQSLYERTQQMIKASEDKRRLIAQITPATIQEKPKYENSTLTESDKDSLMQQILVAMETNDDIYSENFSLDQLAQMVDAKPNHVSQVINEKYDGGFYAMLNEYRIKEACRRMNDKANYSNLTIEAIAQSVGFKSRSNFSRTFKAITGLTPSAYQKMGKK